MDWIDLVVLCICYACSLFLMFMLDEFGISIDESIWAELVIFPLIGGGLVARRKLIGPPKPRYLRPGFLASVISILGIFAVLIGLFSVMASSPGVIITLGATPEVNKEEIRDEITAPRDDFFSQRLDRIDEFMQLQQPNESTEEWKQRLVKQELQEKANLEERISEQIQFEQEQLEDSWHRKRSRTRKGLGWGVFLTIVGVLLLEFRSLRLSTENTES